MPTSENRSGRVAGPLRGALSRALLACLVPALGGCLHQLAADTSAREETLWSLEGSVRVATWTGAPVVVAVLRTPDEPGAPFAIVDYDQLFARDATFHFFVDSGRYRLVAFVDENGDLELSPGEPVGAYGGFLDLTLEGGGRRTLVIDIGDAQPAAAQLPPLEEPDGAARSLYVGDVTSLRAPRFSPANARLGVWEPLRFMREVGAGIFFLEPYDPERTPVLFVHGLGGQPREFAAMIARLDRSRYQAWVAHYPSGWELGESAEVFHRLLNEAAAVHDVERVCIVAHSMGALLTRQTLSRYADERPRPFVRGFVSIAAPLGGHPDAALGVELAPVVVPSWRSLVPSSAFVRGAYAHPLPDEVRYALLFTYDGEHATDGVVPLTSQLRADAQAEADLERGFVLSHTEALRAERVWEVVDAELDRCATAP